MEWLLLFSYSYYYHSKAQLGKLFIASMVLWFLGQEYHDHLEKDVPVVSNEEKP